MKKIEETWKTIEKVPVLGLLTVFLIATVGLTAYTRFEVRQRMNAVSYYITELGVDFFINDQIDFALAASFYGSVINLDNDIAVFNTGITLEERGEEALAHVFYGFNTVKNRSDCKNHLKVMAYLRDFDSKAVKGFLLANSLFCTYHWSEWDEYSFLVLQTRTAMDLGLFDLAERIHAKTDGMNIQGGYECIPEIESVLPDLQAENTAPFRNEPRMTALPYY